MPNQPPSVALVALDVPKRTKPSNYPEPFASQMQGREKRTLGDLFGLTNFGVNLTKLAPSAVSSLRHAHTTQDEFIYILEGNPTLHTDEGRSRLSPGMCAGWLYPDDDLKAVLLDGKWVFQHKDGTPY
jgi:uncharacterized cupin superfamily protein